MINTIAGWIFGILMICFTVNAIIWNIARLIKALRYHRTREEKGMLFYGNFWGNEWEAENAEEIEELKRMVEQFKERHNRQDNQKT
ncbi:MAG: hypothetical protein NC305_07740 [Lachnospiraceae bacterium]|nr:hypothetical protein [Butyrivibrio sp.]MCM1343101.1 hypothetical protein [Muribaculaceae bacterium]MCM1410422.1 hypothetical protein [Lachnospiraceae bacterium]